MPQDPDLVTAEVAAVAARATLPKHTYDQVARALGISPKTVMRWVKAGQVPSPTYLGTLARFTDSQLATIASGPALAGFYPPAASPRAAAAAEGRKALEKRAKEAARKRLARAKSKAAREGGAA